MGRTHEEVGHLPASKYDEPRSRHEEPHTEFGKPRTENITPQTNHDGLRTGDASPRIEHDALRTGDANPRIEHDALRIANDEPHIEHEELKIANDEPHIEDEELKTSYEEPKTPEAAATAVEIALKMLEGRWKLTILFHLFGGKILRFSELERAIPGISQKMLSQQLRQLESDGIVSRQIYPEVPPKVEYRLTPWGQTLCPSLDSLLRWAANAPTQPAR